MGALTCAFLERWTQGRFDFDRVEVTAYEFDEALRRHLENTLAPYASGCNAKFEILGGDFIELASTQCLDGKAPFTHAILNPPYKKISTDSQHRLSLREVGIETVNLYSAFVALTLALMEPGGQVVAIIPRSFCNGPYYRPFRDFILARAALRRMHLFDSRSKAFKEDEVLQENLILLLERGCPQGDVVISTSTDDSFSDLTIHTHPFNRIVFPKDTQRFVHVPTSLGRGALELTASVHASLEDIGVSVSTGPVVDFRLKEHLRAIPGPGSVPLLYATHFRGSRTEWPKLDQKKPNAIERNHRTERWLYPSGYYCVVRRFSSKEEKRRIVASVVEPTSFNGDEVLGFENHLNVFHELKHGLPETLARGLAVYLNTTAVDESFRRFNGHTQVNATDLKTMTYPSRASLMALGKWAMGLAEEPTQASIDNQLDKLTR